MRHRKIQNYCSEAYTPSKCLCPVADTPPKNYFICRSLWFECPDRTMELPCSARRAAHLRYKLISGNGDTVGRGTYGRVYQAVDQLTGDVVAVKTQNKDTDSARREIATYELLRSYPHQNIARMLNRYMDPDTKKLCIVFDYHPTSIKKLTITPEGRHGTFPRWKVIGYIRGIAQGVSHLHAHGLVHGDLSLGNILVGADDTVKVTDFGFAHCAHTFICPDDHHATCYVRSPEQWADCPTSGAPADCWAVGVVSMVLLTGECPFHSERDAAECVFPAMVSLLGTVTAASWPDHSNLKGWSKLSPFNKAGIEPSLISWLAARPRAKPMGEGDLASDVVKAWLRWNPADRPAVQTVLSFPVFKQYRSADADGNRCERCGLPKALCCLQHQHEIPMQPTAPSPIPCATGVVRNEGSVSADALAQAADALLPTDLSREAPGHCQCSGHCARKLCVKRANRRRSVPQVTICNRQPVHGGRLCLVCKCEHITCLKGKARGGSRWCQEHDETFSKRAGRAGWYANCYGVHQYAKHLSPILKVVARCAFVLPLLLPEDYLKFQTVCRKWCEPRCSGSSISGTALAVMFFAHAVKWPPAMLRFIEVLPPLAEEAPQIVW